MGYAANLRKQVAWSRENDRKIKGLLQCIIDSDRTDNRQLCTWVQTGKLRALHGRALWFIYALSYILLIYIKSTILIAD